MTGKERRAFEALRKQAMRVCEEPYIEHDFVRDDVERVLEETLARRWSVGDTSAVSYAIQAMSMVLGGYSDAVDIAALGDFT